MTAPSLEPESTPPRRGKAAGHLKEDLGCLATLIFFFLTAIGSGVVSLLGGPKVGLVVPPLAVALWLWLGPRPLPGLFQGVAMMWVLCGNLTYWLWSIYQAVRSWPAWWHR